MLHLIKETEHKHLLSALRLPLPPSLLKELKAALTGYDMALIVKKNEAENLGRAAEIAKNAAERAAADTAVALEGGKLHNVPVEILQRVVEAESAESFAALALKVAERAVVLNAARPAAVLASWGPEGTKWAATQRATAGPDGIANDLTRYVWQRCGGVYRVPGEVYNGFTDNLVALNAYIKFETTDRTLPDPIGPTANNHPHRNGKRNAGGLVDLPTMESLKFYDTARHQRVVQYWACCAIAAGETQLKGGCWTIRADWDDRQKLFERYANTSATVADNVDA
jgi:hypothetical protein